MPRLRLFLVSLGAGTLMSLFGFGGLLLGAWIDTSLGYSPCLSLLLAFLGLVVGIFLAYRLLMWGFRRQ